MQVFSMLIIDQHTFEVVHCHTLMQQEYATSILSCKLGDDPTPYYIVGTGFIHPEESEPKTGRLIVFSWADGKLSQVGHNNCREGNNQELEISFFNRNFCSTAMASAFVYLTYHIFSLLSQ